MTDYMVEGLAKKRGEVAGAIERTHELLGKLVNDLAHIDAVLAIIAPDMAVEAIRPMVFQAPEDWSKRGEMSRIILSILRTARQPLTSREIAAQLVLERGMPADEKLMRLMTKRCSTALREQRDKGRAVSEDGPGTHLLWRITR